MRRFLTGGRSAVDFDYPRSESSAVRGTGNTVVGRWVAGYGTLPPHEAGFTLLTNGIDALAVRLLLAKHAEKTLDAQYYLITDDLIGFAFIGALLDAADRGVRVRLLLDDIQTQGYDAGLTGLDAHPNIEVRVFNPFAQRGLRAGSAFDFSRINRRMHNKSFTVDNQVTIIGGRNIAAEYFAASEDVNFGDADVLGIGPVVRDVSSMFDLYWNYRASLPVPAFAKMSDDPGAALAKLRARLTDEKTKLRQSKYGEAFSKTLQGLGTSVRDGLIAAPYEVVYDAPEKSDRKLAKTAASIIPPLAAAISRAKDQLVIVSPYFVPLKSGVRYLADLGDRGVQVTVITNSLASNNHASVHAGYAPYRKSLLEDGTRLYEMRADAQIIGVDRGTQGAALATLHSKAFLVDDREFFLGSFNWDPRSIGINTELGVIIKSPRLAADVRAYIDSRLGGNAYEVMLSDKHDLSWIDRAGGADIVLDKEPQTSWCDRFVVGFYRMLPMRGQL